MSFRSHFSSRSAWGRSVSALVLAVMTIAVLTFSNPALAGLKDDRYDGEIFALYAGNGSLVPPKVKLEDSFNKHKPALMVFYTDDSSDSQQFSSVVSQLLLHSIDRAILHCFSNVVSLKLFITR